MQDLVLDCPDAAHQLTLFLARAVVDGVLQASFLQSVLPSLSDASLGVSVVQSAGEVHLQSMKHRALTTFSFCRE